MSYLKIIFTSFLLLCCYVNANALTVTSYDSIGAPITLFHGTPQNFGFYSQIFVPDDGRICRPPHSSQIRFATDNEEVEITFNSPNDTWVDPFKLGPYQEKIVTLRHGLYCYNYTNVAVKAKLFAPIKDIVPSNNVISFKKNAWYASDFYRELPGKTGFEQIKNYADPNSFPPKTVFCVAVDHTFGNYKLFYFIATKTPGAISTQIETHGRLWDPSFTFKGPNGEDNPAGIVSVGNKEGYMQKGPCK